MGGRNPVGTGAAQLICLHLPSEMLLWGPDRGRRPDIPAGAGTETGIST